MEKVTAEALRILFGSSADFSERELRLGGVGLHLCFLDGLCSGSEIAETVLRPLSELARHVCHSEEPGDEESEPKRKKILRSAQNDREEALYRMALEGMVYAGTCAVCETLDDAAEKLLSGWCLLLFSTGTLAFEVKGGDRRGVSPPEVENTAKGPKDAFTETLRTNTALLRRHLGTPELRLWQTVVGKKSRTAVTVCSVEGLTDPDLVRAMEQRLSQIDIDGFTTPAAVEESVTGSRATAFPLLQSTQRTDRFVTGLLGGRVGLLVDGLPVGWLAPVDLGLLMSAAEDRGTDYLSASFVRLLRYGALGISLLLPALYVAMAEFHQEMIPTALLKAMIESKQSVPFPTVLEVLGLLLAFEILQEAGITLPQAISQTVSIIGGLVVGTAAVEANLISPSALIVVAAAGICGFALPGKELADAVRLWRLGLTVLASVAGLFGLTLGSLALLIRLSALESLGTPYLNPFSSFHAGALVRPRLKEKDSSP